MLVFSVETSCDETSVCIMKEDKTFYLILYIHKRFTPNMAGVVPELASRAHLEILQKITKEDTKRVWCKIK